MPKDAIFQNSRLINNKVDCSYFMFLRENIDSNMYKIISYANPQIPKKITNKMAARIMIYLLIFSFKLRLWNLREYILIGATINNDMIINAIITAVSPGYPNL